MKFKILQGQDATYLLKFKLNGVEVNLSTYSQYYIVVFDSGKKIIARYSREAQAGYESLDASGQALGNVQFLLSREVTKLLPNVQLYYVMLTQQTSGEENFYSGSCTAQELVYIERSPLPIIP